MSSIRLTDDLRCDIRKALLERKSNKVIVEINAGRDALIPKFAKLAEDVYNAKYSSKERKTLNDLPKGFVPERDDVKVRFGESSHGWKQLEFNGSDGNFNRTGMKEFPASKPVMKRFKASDEGTPLLIEKKDPLAVRYFALAAEKEALEEKHKALVAEINRVLNSVTMTGALIKLWPEVEPILKKISPASTKPGLPAPILSGLNDRLGLSGVAA